MPQSPTPFMLLVQPTEGGDDDVWDTLLTALFLLVDAHDHTTGKGAPLGSASVTIDADLDFHDFRGVSVGGLDLTNLGAALTTGANEVFATGGNLYFRSGAGANVQITNGAALNMTTVGGIAGDYTSAGAEVAFVNASDSYTFKQQLGGGVRQWAPLESGDLLLYEYLAHPAVAPPTTFVRLRSPAALAASYNMTLPAALPALTPAIVQISTAGVMSFSNTIAAAVNLSSVLGVAGLITADGGLTAGANQHVTVSGTGEFKHGDLVRVVSPLAGQGSGFTLTAGVGYVASSGANTWFMSIPLDQGERLTAVSYSVYGDSAADVTVNIYHYTKAAVATLLGSATVLNEGPAWAHYTIAGLAATTITDGAHIVAEFTVTAANLRIGPVRATYTRP